MSSRTVMTLNFKISTGYDNRLETYFLNIKHLKIDELLFDSLLMEDPRCLDVGNIKIILRGFGIIIHEFFWESFCKDFQRLECGKFAREFDFVEKRISIRGIEIFKKEDIACNDNLSDDEKKEAINWYDHISEN